MPHLNAPSPTPLSSTASTSAPATFFPPRARHQPCHSSPTAFSGACWRSQHRRAFCHAWHRLWTGARTSPVAATAHGPSSSSASAPTLLDGLSFYAILGVDPLAEPRAIRQAYHSLMRDLHPDRAASRAETDAPSETLHAAAADLCVLINQIYEVLSDDERRAAYDALSGFSACSVNPFLDSSYVRDQIFVDEISCIGCGKCVRWANGTFEIEASKFGRARVINQSGNTLDEVQVAIETCPVDCIHWVTLPQLSLLESVLATMDRIEVSVMQRTQRSGGNVFQEAFKAHERRQAVIADARAAAAAGPRQQQARPKVDWSFWGSGSLEREQMEEEQRQQEQASRDPVQQRIARLAVSAARAARMWQAYLQSRSVLRSLSSGTSIDDG